VRKAKAQPENTVDTILQAGQIVDGKYRVDRLLGQGGMAAVWAGINERTGKRVALKVILQSLATTREAQQLLHSEALAASRVNHPNVVTVFDVIEHEGMTCIVMELLDGEPLGSYIARQGYLSVSEATAVLLPAMRGVAAANAQGVIHRDLKPQNIFICIGPDGRIVTTKVLDFGISVMVERVRDPSTRPFEGATLGTPAYMSPEHISGAANIDQRADVYGFGVLLYEALTGQMPFPGDQGQALFDRILTQPAPSVTLFRPDLPPGLVHIIEKAMAKQPDQRYSGLNSMVSAIEDEVAPATPPPRLLTPIAGVPSVALRDGPVVQAVVKPEPSQQTQILFGFPLEKESKESVPDQETKLLFGLPMEQESKESVPDGGGEDGSNEAPREESAGAGEPLGGSDDTSEERGTRPLTGRNTIRLRGKFLLPEKFFRPETLSPLRGWRGVAGVGGVVAVVLVFWMAMRDARPARTHDPVTGVSTPTAVAPVPAAVAPPPGEATPAPAAVVPAPAAAENPLPSASEPAASPVVPAVVQAATEPPAAALAPSAAPSSLEKPSTPAAIENHKPAIRGRAVPVPGVTNRSSVAVRETSKEPVQRRQPVRTGSKLDESEWVPPSAQPKASAPAKPAPAPKAVASPKPLSPRAATSLKPMAPRAGSLSADDF